MITLATYKGSDPVEIIDIVGDALIVSRLYEMGFVPGEMIAIQHRMMMGGPLIVFVQKTSVALRQEEASCINVHA